MVRKLGRGDELVQLKASLQARKQWLALPEVLTARLLNRSVDGMLDSRWAFRRKLPELVRQELWGVLLTYNPGRYQMVRMAFELKGDHLPYQLSFSCAISEIMRLLITLPLASPGKMPGELRMLYEQARWLVLPGRSYPQELRVKSRKYPEKKKLVTLSDQH